MLGLRKQPPMPHATTSDSSINLLPSWSTSRAPPFTLPPPSYSQHLALPKPVFTANNGVFTPSEMNGVARSNGVYSRNNTNTVGSGNNSYDLGSKMLALRPVNSSSSTSRTFGSGSTMGSSKTMGSCNTMGSNNTMGSSNTFVSSYRPSGSTDTGSPRTKSSVSSFAADVHSERRRSSIDEEAVAPALRLPPTVHAPQPSLPQLVAEVTCLFWFETGTTLRQIEEASPLLPATPSPAISPDVKPHIGFRKWVVTLLSTTQVTQNVILLALMFIYRLKSFNPTVKGKPGSEYRLLTVALMLGNKFLDDNTYTNKTWAEVSGISVQEVHIMEVEFLSNMRYSLYTSEATWKQWHAKLGRFGTFADRAIHMLESPARVPVLHHNLSAASSAPPSPPASTNASPPFQANYSPLHLTGTNTPLLLPQIGSTAVSPIGPLPEIDMRLNSRKRSYDDNFAEPSAKRHAPAYSLQLPLPVSTPGSDLSMSHASSHQRVSLPSLSIPNSASAPGPQHIPQLPLPGSRAMTLVYPPPVQWNALSSIPTNIPPLQTTSLPPVTSALDASRQLSPYPLGSANSSPLAGTFPPGTIHTPTHSRLSPSYYLAQRSSPYRPVRRVQTLLVPPPSASMHNPARPITQDQMQYHPLGRPMSERRVGHLPYIHHDAWPQTHQLNQWPELQPPPRQPIFQ